MPEAGCHVAEELKTLRSQTLETENFSVVHWLFKVLFTNLFKKVELFSSKI